MLNRLKSKQVVIIAAVLIVGMLVSTFAYRVASTSRAAGTVHALATRTPQVTPTDPPTPTPLPTPSLTPTATPLPAPNPASVLGIDSSPTEHFPGLPWIRLGYPTCGWGNLTGSVLRNTVAAFHSQGIHILLITCQAASSGPRLLNTQQLDDVAHSGADAIQCGNEQMKYDSQTTYVAPVDFARYYDLCVRAVRAVQPNVPVIMGALDPHVGGVDYGPLYNQLGYLNQMQAAMNSVVHPGGNWQWRSQIIGLIDSWHNGYPNDGTNSLGALFAFWAQQFGVSLDNGDLGKHLWVVEGTGCFKGCGLNPYNSYEVAVSHILTLIIDVRTTMRYHVPFFYFSGADFLLNGVYWPIGVLSPNGKSKPIRQDLPMGARVLVMGCPGGQARVSDQEQLLARLYSGCSLPSDYLSVLWS